MVPGKDPAVLGNTEHRAEAQWREASLATGATRPDPSRFWQFPVEDELVVARPDIEGLFYFNSTARLLWEERNRGASLGPSLGASLRSSLNDAAHTLAELFGIPAGLAQRDIELLLKEWSAGILAPPILSGEPDCVPAGPSLPAERPEAPAEVVTIDCAVGGRTFRVRLEAGDLVEEIAPRLAGLRVTLPPDEHPDATFTLTNGTDRVFIFRDETLIAAEPKTAGARAILLQEISAACHPAHAVSAVLHAGACGTESAGILLAGASYSGKSTLCAALMAQGLLCYGDDSAIIRDDFQVAGMPFPLTLRKAAWSALEGVICSERLRSHTRLGMEVGFLDSNIPADASLAAPIEALVFVNYQPHAQTVLRPLTVFETLLRLRQSGFWIKHTHTDIARFLGWLTLLPRYTLTYSRLNEAAAEVAVLLPH